MQGLCDSIANNFCIPQPPLLTYPFPNGHIFKDGLGSNGKDKSNYELHFLTFSTAAFQAISAVHRSNEAILGAARALSTLYQHHVNTVAHADIVLRNALREVGVDDIVATVMDIMNLGLEDSDQQAVDFLDALNNRLAARGGSLLDFHGGQ